METLSQLLKRRPEFADAAHYYALACEASRAWNALLSESLEKYGSHGAQISGCGREHFPEPVKDRLRSLAYGVARFSGEASASRPHRVRQSTMNHLARLVATRDGSGFYGPQPYRDAH